MVGGGLRKLMKCGRSGGRTPRPPLVLHNHINQSTSDTWCQWIGPLVLTSLATNDMCHPSIRQPSTNESVPHHPPDTSSYGWYGSSTSPYGLYGQVQSASKIFACLAWQTDRDIFSIRTPFEKVNIPPESGRRDGRNGTVFVAFRAL
jgi:hypothetical protein